ncbi:hypothetical protein Q4592_06130 [Agarivorans sp. 1_MG-2023]|nr:hypothetical protein [Agarivorans sp. 1_MG-2023]MDO6763117.1 hypothetical protein [Agarivorans sp. 1_MG-2023]
MRKHIGYTSKQQRVLSTSHGCWWKTPQQTFEDGYGFCYDLAAFALHGLELSNIACARLLFVSWGEWGGESNAGHFVCVYQQNDGYFCIDNGRLKGPFTFKQLLLATSRNHKLKSYRWFEKHDIAYHTRYSDMTGFSDSTLLSGI